VDELNEMPATERIHRMENDENNLADDFGNEEDSEPGFDFWSDEGARRFNEIIEEGSAYIAANPTSIVNYEEDFVCEDCDHRDPDLYDLEEETLSPGDMEIILENSYIF
jgi:hypothetical protein